MIHILVVEDDVKLNQIVCTYLNNSSFLAKGCLSVKEAYEEMYNNLYELIISDIMMPEIDGFEFARTVRQVNKTIPILFKKRERRLSRKGKRKAIYAFSFCNLQRRPAPDVRHSYRIDRADE